MPNRARRLRAAKTAARRAGADAERPGNVRLQRVMADAGVAARRTCEQMIEAGRVQVNGQTVTRLPVFVDPRTDRVVVDGKPLPAAPTASARGREGPRHAYILLNKPERVLTTTVDEGGRRTVMDLVEWKGPQRIYPVGRLDFHAGGLVLLTSDGDLANRLSHARFGVPRTYDLTVRGGVSTEQLAEINKALGYRPPPAPVASPGSPPTGQPGEAPPPKPARGKKADEPEEPRPPAAIQDWTLGAFEGAPFEKQRELGKRKTVVRVTVTPSRYLNLPDVFLRVGLHVTKIVQSGLGGPGVLELGALPLGKWRELEPREISALKRAADDRPRPRPEPKPAPVDAPPAASAAPPSRPRPSRPERPGPRGDRQTYDARPTRSPRVLRPPADPEAGA